MASHICINLGLPFDVLDQGGHPLARAAIKLIIPFDDDGAHEARQRIVVQALDGLPPGFHRTAFTTVAGEVVRDDRYLEQ